MRKLNLALLLLVVFAMIGTATAATVEIHRKDGGEWGYADIDEWHGEDFHKLWCENPGFSKCDWTTRPTVHLIQYADNQIAAGNFTGTYWEIVGVNKYTIHWTATDMLNADIVETQEVISSVE